MNCNGAFVMVYVTLVTVSERTANGIVSILVAPMMAGCDRRVEDISLRTPRHRELRVNRAVCTASVADLPIVFDSMCVFVHILCGIGLLPTPSRLNAVMFDSSLLLIGIALFGSMRTMLLSPIRLIGMALKRLLVVLQGPALGPLDLLEMDIQVVELLILELLVLVIPWNLFLAMLVVRLLLAARIRLCMFGKAIIRVACGVVLISVARPSLVPDRVNLLTVLLEETTSIMVYVV